MSHKFPKNDYGLAMDMLSTSVACLYNERFMNISRTFQLHSLYIFQIYTGHSLNIHRLPLDVSLISIVFTAYVLWISCEYFMYFPLDLSWASIEHFMDFQWTSDKHLLNI